MLCLKRKQFKQQAYKKCAFHYEVFFGNEKDFFFRMLYFEGFCNFHFLSVIFRLLILDIPIFHERMANAVFMLPRLLLFLLMLFVGIVTVLNYYCYLFATIICFFFRRLLLLLLLLFRVAFSLSLSLSRLPFHLRQNVNESLCVYAPYVCIVYALFE